MFLQTVLSIALIVIFGSLFNVLTSALIISLVANVIRKYSGGAHASSLASCAAIGVITTISFAILIKISGHYINLKILWLVGTVCFSYANYYLWRLSPVDSISKPITNLEIRKKLKLKSLVVLNSLIIVCILLIMYYYYSNDINLLIYIECIFAGVFWQIFTLTPSGHKFINHTDKLLKK